MAQAQPGQCMPTGSFITKGVRLSNRYVKNLCGRAIVPSQQRKNVAFTL